MWDTTGRKPYPKMEEFDELEAKPDEEGVIDISHRAYRALDDSLFTWGEVLVTLNVS